MSGSSSTTVLYGPPKVGGDILAFCTRCKIELAHVVVSMIDRRPARVMCKTCKGQHNFKRTSGAPIPGTRAPRKAAAPRVSMRASEYWDQKMATKSGVPMIPYSPKELFSKDQVLKHPQFGIGIIEEVRLGGKIVVLFREGEKILVHGMGQPSV